MSLLMDTQTNRFWARVDFLATGEIVIHIPEEYELPIRVLVSRGGRSTEYEPNRSEKPNNCEAQTEPLPKTINGVKIADAVAWADKWLEDNPISEMWDMIRTLRDATEWQTEPQNYCDDCLYCETCDSKEFFWACTSKAVKKPKTEPQTNADQHTQHVGSVESVEQTEA